MQGTQGRYAWEAEHKVAVALTDLCLWEDAYAMMQWLLHQFREIGDLRSQAEVMQDLMKYWRHKGDLDQAEDLGWQAFVMFTGIPLFDNSYDDGSEQPTEHAGSDA